MTGEMLPAVRTGQIVLVSIFQFFFKIIDNSLLLIICPHIFLCCLFQTAKARQFRIDFFLRWQYIGCLKQICAIFQPITILLCILFFILPFFTGIYYSLFNWDGISTTKKFIGLKNYVELFTDDPDYFKSLIFTLKYVVLNVFATNILALVLAMICNSRLKSKKFLRTCFFQIGRASCRERV